MGSPAACTFRTVSPANRRGRDVSPLATMVCAGNSLQAEASCGHETEAAVTKVRCGSPCAISIGVAPLRAGAGGLPLAVDLRGGARASAHLLCGAAPQRALPHSSNRAAVFGSANACSSLPARTLPSLQSHPSRRVTCCAAAAKTRSVVASGFTRGLLIGSTGNRLISLLM